MEILDRYRQRPVDGSNTPGVRPVRRNSQKKRREENSFPLAGIERATSIKMAKIAQTHEGNLAK